MANVFHPGVADELRARLRALREESPALWGRMNAHQAVCHLADAFRMALGERPLPLRTNFLFRTVIRWVALTAPLPFPKRAPTAPELDQARGGGSPPGAFRDDVEALERLLERFVGSGGVGLHPHLAFGDLSPGEWGRWAWRHTDHHLRQFGV